MSETSRALGLPGHIEVNGKRLVVSRITFQIEARFELWLEENLSKGLERARGHTAPATWQERVRLANEQIAGRALAWTGTLAQRAVLEPEGFKELSYLCLTVDTGNLWTRQQHEALCNDLAQFKELIRIIDQISAPVPNGPAPEPPSGATSSPPPNSSASLSVTSSA